VECARVFEAPAHAPGAIEGQEGGRSVSNTGPMVESPRDRPYDDPDIMAQLVRLPYEARVCGRGFDRFCLETQLL